MGVVRTLDTNTCVGRNSKISWILWILVQEIMSLYLWKQQRIHEQLLQEDNLVPYQHKKEIQDWWTISNEERNLELEIEESLASLSPDLDSSYILEYDETILDIYITNDEENPKYEDCIETQLQDIVKLQYHSLLQHFLLSNQIDWLVPHIQVSIEVNFSYLDMDMFLTLLRTWLHWKSSCTWIKIFLFF